MMKLTETERTSIITMRDEKPPKSYNEISRKLGGKVSPQYCQQYYNAQKLKTFLKK